MTRRKVEQHSTGRRSQRRAARRKGASAAPPRYGIEFVDRGATNLTRAAPKPRNKPDDAAIVRDLVMSEGSSKIAGSLLKPVTGGIAGASGTVLGGVLGQAGGDIVKAMANGILDSFKEGTYAEGSNAAAWIIHGGHELLPEQFIAVEEQLRVAGKSERFLSGFRNTIHTGVDGRTGVTSDLAKGGTWDFGQSRSGLESTAAFVTSVGVGTVSTLSGPAAPVVAPAAAAVAKAFVADIADLGRDGTQADGIAFAYRVLQSIRDGEIDPLTVSQLKAVQLEMVEEGFSDRFIYGFSGQLSKGTGRTKGLR